jgi:maltose-binding protein MalE
LAARSTNGSIPWVSKASQLTHTLKNAKAASQLAAYITNKKSQLIAHKEAGQIPVLKSAVNSSAVKSDPVAEVRNRNG